MRGTPAFALQRFNQRRLLAADVCSGPDNDLDIEIETRSSEYVVAQQLLLSPACQDRFKVRQQIAVFAAQIQQALLCANCVSACRHTFEYCVSMAVQQDTILECSGFTFVRIADYIARCTLGLSTEFPFHAGAESCPASPAQTGLDDFCQCAIDTAHKRLTHSSACRKILAEQQAVFADTVTDVEPFGRPICKRCFSFNQIGDAHYFPGIKSGDRPAVDQQSGTVIAHSDA